MALETADTKLLVKKKKMKIYLKVLSCGLLFQFSNEHVFASSQMITRFSTSEMGRSLCARSSIKTVPGQYSISSTYNCNNFTAIRGYSHFIDPTNPNCGKQINLDKMENEPKSSTSYSKFMNLLKKRDGVIRQINDCLDKLKQIDESEKKIFTQEVTSDISNTQHSVMELGNTVHELNQKRKIATITPINSEKTGVTSFDVEDNSLYHHNISKMVAMIREDLVDRIIRSARDASKVRKEEVVCILNLYSDLACRPKESITKVLNGSTDTSKSVIYNAAVAHAQSRQLTIGVYRDIYTRLGEAFGKEPMKVLYSIVEEMMQEKDHSLSLLRNRKNNRTHDDYVNLIVLGANPLYPLHANEVEAVLELYVTLSDRPKESITKVLNGSTDTPKSVIYNAVMVHVDSKKSDLEIYRNIYARLSKSLNQEAIQVIHHMVSQNIQKNDDHNQFSLKQSLIVKNAPPEISKEFVENNNNEKTPVLAVKNLSEPETNLNISERSEGLLCTNDGKYSISKKEQERLNRIYGLLPEYHSKSITGVLSGATKRKDLPVLKDVLAAIDQVQKEAVQEGSHLNIDLHYFRKLYWTSIRVVGKGGSRETECKKEKIESKVSPKLKKTQIVQNIKKSNTKK